MKCYSCYFYSFGVGNHVRCRKYHDFVTERQTCDDYEKEIEEDTSEIVEKVSEVLDKYFC